MTSRNVVGSTMVTSLSGREYTISDRLFRQAVPHK
jgi:hypothetical protein